MYTLLLLVLVSACFGKLQRGMVINPTPMNSCPPGFNANASCTNVTIVCKNTANIWAVYGVIEPCNEFRGTVPLLNGGFGTGPMDNGFVAAHRNNGFRVIQVEYQPPGGWELTNDGRQNLRVAGCRPEALLEYLFDVEHYGDTTTGFCVQGQSGGSTSIGFTMSWYGGDDFIDYAMLGSGPNFSDVVKACTSPSPPEITVCPPGQNYCGQTCQSYQNQVSFNGTFAACSSMLENLTGYPCWCPTTPPTKEMLDWWADESLVGKGAQMKFDHTGLSTILCAPGINSSPGQAQIYGQGITAKNGYHMYLISNCTSAENFWTGKFLPTGDSGVTYAANIMLRECVPRHNS